tara:strand:- start:550 stop:831 length:282 start_codon:yes stop_codon:yes gene_type:complete
MVKLKELLKEDLITERKLESYDTSEMNELLKRLNKLTADINKLWPQLQKTKAKTKWAKAQNIGYALQGLGRNMMHKLDRVRNIMDAPEYDDDE